MSQTRLVVFTDLDGTLLDHHSYDWSAARPALDRLAEAGVPVVMNSSKTVAEIAELRARMGNRAPFIVENGAAVVIPENCFGPVPERQVSFGANHAELMQALAELRGQGSRFRSFADMTPDELSALAGLSPDAAGRAQQRTGTEPLLWLGSDAERTAFERALAERGLRLVAGGRFLHVMGQFDKADGVRYLADRYRQQYPEDRLVTVALGDSPNDQAMLAAVDVPVIVRGVKSDQLSLPSERHVMRSLKAGPAGWNECVLNILIEYGI